MTSPHRPFSNGLPHPFSERNRSWRALVAAILLLPATLLPGAEPAPIALESFTAGRVWWTNPDQLEQKAPKEGFRWVSVNRDTATIERIPMHFLGVPAYKTDFAFHNDYLAQITVLFHTLGDRGNITRETFDACIQSLVTRLNESTGSKFTTRTNTRLDQGTGLLWNTPDVAYSLEYASSNTPEFQADFIQLVITPKKTLAREVQSSHISALNPSKVARNNQTGEVVIEGVPMVDQGEKGYCSVATLERLLRFYGLTLNEHQLAKMAGTTASGGTDMDSLIPVLKSFEGVKLRFIPIESMTVKSMERMVENYNRAAKSLKAPPIVRNDPYMYDAGEIYGQVRADVLTKAVASPGAVDAFLQSIRTHVDRGNPLIWSVQLGIFPELDIPQQRGGHTRLIIGYNLRTREIFYTDSWGEKHELKRMPAVNARAMTTVLSVLAP